MNQISKGLWLCIALVCVCFKRTHGGTAVDFSVSPAVIVESLTKSVHMNCAVNDLSKRAWSTNATEDVDHVVSITVANDDGTIIAKVAENGEPTVENDKGRLTASGSASGNAHLDLTFAAPSEMDMGVYKCNVFAISTANRHMWLGRTVNAKTRPATVPDVISDLKNLKQKQINDLKNLESQLENQKQKQINDNQKHDDDIKDLKQCMSRKSGFMAVMSSGKTVARGQTAVFDKVIYTTGSGYDPSTGIFTCDEPGIYSFSVTALSSNRHNVNVAIMVNSDEITSAYALDNVHVNTAAASALVHLNKNDVVRVKSTGTYSSYFYTSIFYHLPQANVFVGQLEQSDCFN